MADIWRYCPRCYTVGRTTQVRCTYCVLAPRLQVVPASVAALEATFRIGGADAVEELVAGLVAGQGAVEALIKQREDAAKLWEEKFSW